MDLGEKAGIFGGETGQSHPNGSNQTRFSPLVWNVTSCDWKRHTQANEVSRVFVASLILVD